MTVQPRDDTSYMLEAVALAARTPSRTWPNPPVGALVVRDDGRIIGRGAHLGPGTAHAETVALDEAGAAAQGSTLYCTLEPCNHQGRTPPCAPRVAGSGIRRLVVGVRDPNPHVAGGGLAVVRRAGVDITLGVSAAECLDLIWPFVVTGAFARPYLLLKTATSLDGRFAPLPVGGQVGPAYLTGPEARRVVHRLRRWADLVLVGAGTIRADRPALDSRLLTGDEACPGAESRPGYVDTGLCLDVAWPGRPHLVFAGREHATPTRVRTVQRREGTVVLCDERDDGRVAIASLVEHLPRVGVHSLMVEGGPRLASSFLAEGLVDRWVSFLAPLALGTGVGWPGENWLEAGSEKAQRETGSFHLTRCASVGPDACLVYDRVSFDDTLRQLTTAPPAMEA